MKIKIPAKINLTLDIVGIKDGFHQLQSLVAPINLFDSISVKKRRDKNITLTEKGIPSGVQTEKNNAYKTAKLFMETFNVNGVDITINKKIFVGGGLGGSSADIAGVLLCMKKLFKIEESVLPLASKLGSDVIVMLQKKQAVMSGKGDCVTPLKKKAKLNMLLLLDNESLSAKDAYIAFDKAEKCYLAVTQTVVDKIEKGDDSYILDLSNHLQPVVEERLDRIKRNVLRLKDEGAINALMTGSGSATFGIFKDKKSLKKAYGNLYKDYKDCVIKIKTL